MLIKSNYLTVDGTAVLKDHVVRVRGGAIAGIRPARRSDRPDVDAGRALLMPGLVNAHCHLELSYARGRLVRGRSIAPWLRELVPTYRGVRWPASIRAGLRRAAATGTTAVGDIRSRADVATPIRMRVYAEVIGPWPAREEAGLAAAIRRGDGVSPHAPYTTSARAYRACARTRLPMATHIAETREEARLLRRGDGPFVPLFKHFGARFPFDRPPGLTPIRWLDGIGVLRRRVALIHCNYLDDADVALIARRGCTVVFCPGSHAFFGHRAHPVRRLLRAGVPVALGTDSWASNDDLSMLREMRLAREGYGLSAAVAIRMATRNGAAALFGSKIGELRRGWAADLTCVAVPRGADPLEHATLAEPRVKFSIAAGRWVRAPRS